MIVNDCHHDTTAHVFEKMLDGGTTREYILEDDECPLHILHQRDRGAVTFHIKRRAGDTGGQGGCSNRALRVQPSVIEVGSEVGPRGVQLPGLLPRHHTEGTVTVTPCPHAEVRRCH